MYDVIILGSGPAGLTAAIYTTRANLKTLIIAGNVWGGQLMLTTLVENYPGFPEGIQGPDLMMAMRKQAERHGAEIAEVNFQEGDFSPSTLRPIRYTQGRPEKTEGRQAQGSGQAKQPLVIKTVDGKTYEGRSVIISTGADTKWLNVVGEKELIGRGVSSCATCDAAFFRGKNVIVVGGGDTAMEDSLFLTKFATSVTVVHRRDSLRASHVMQERARQNPKIQFIFDTAVSQIIGSDKVSAVKLKNLKTNEEKEMAIDGVFVAIGHVPNTMVFKGVELDEHGYVAVHDRTRTNVAGVFVAGDVHDKHYQQAVTAAGFGCMAALDLEKWLAEQKA